MYNICDTLRKQNKINMRINAEVKMETEIQEEKEVVLAARMTPQEKGKIVAMATKVGIPIAKLLLALVDQYDSAELTFVPKVQPRAARGRAVLN